MCTTLIRENHTIRQKVKSGKGGGVTGVWALVGLGKPPTTSLEHKARAASHPTQPRERQEEFTCLSLTVLARGWNSLCCSVCEP